MNETMQIEGEWINKNTGQKITVRNSVIDGDKMIIITNMGQISMDDFSRNYIQCSNEIYDNNGNIISDKQSQIQVNNEDEQYLIDDIPVVEFKETDIYSQQIPQTRQIEQVKQKSINNIDLIKKVFDKIDSKPEITVDIKWDNFPKEQISTLVKFLDVNVDDISEYLYSEYANVDSVKIKISDIINKNI